MVTYDVPTLSNEMREALAMGCHREGFGAILDADGATNR